MTPRKDELPTEAYISREEIREDGTPVRRTFEHLPSEMGAEEAEEVGVEHLLRCECRCFAGPGYLFYNTFIFNRDIKDTSVGSISQLTTAHLQGLKGLRNQLQIAVRYLNEVAAGRMPLNHDIINCLQDIGNLLPNVQEPVFRRSMTTMTNDQLMVIYLASAVRGVAALHNLIDNKIRNKSEMEKKVEEAVKEQLLKKSAAAAAATGGSDADSTKKSDSAKK